MRCVRFLPLAPCLPGFLSVFLARFPTAPSSFLGKLRGNHHTSINFPGSEPSLLRLVWAPNKPNRQIPGYFAGIPGKPRVYLENTAYSLPVSSVSPQILPQTSSQTPGNSELPEWSTKHPLVSLEISGNSKCSAHVLCEHLSMYGRQMTSDAME